MNIIKAIGKSIKDATGLAFHYDDKGNLNTILDDAQFPCAISALVNTGAIQDVNGQLHERLTMEVWFCDLSEEDINGLDNEDIISECKKNALTWLTTLRQNDSISLQSINSTQRYYINNADMDVMLTAYAVNVTLDEVEGFGKCDLR